MKNTHDKLVFLDRTEYREIIHTRFLVLTWQTWFYTHIYIYIIKDYNSTKSFKTTIMKRHHVLYHHCEEEIVYNI